MPGWSLSKQQKQAGSAYHILVVAPPVPMHLPIVQAFAPWIQFVVDTVGSGREAIARNASKPYDLAILPFPLLDIEARAVCWALRQQWPVPILGIVHDPQLATAAFLTESCADYLTWPFTTAALLEQALHLLRIEPHTMTG